MMNRAYFQEFMDAEYGKIFRINASKGHDYAGDDDALSNFKDAAERLGMTPYQIWGVYASKHWSAIETFIKEGDVKSEPIAGRIHDIILYGFLLLGLLEEEEIDAERIADGQAVGEDE